MKVLISLVCLLAVVGCSELKNNDTKSESQALCDEQKTSKCILPTQYMIYSKQKLPVKMKVVFKNDSARVVAFSDCDPGSRRSAFLSEGNLMMGFRAVPGLYQEGMGLEIVDAGENCDNDALFFEGVVVPKTTDSWENTKDTKNFNLEN